MNNNLLYICNSWGWTQNKTDNLFCVEIPIIKNIDYEQLKHIGQFYQAIITDTRLNLQNITISA